MIDKNLQLILNVCVYAMICALIIIAPTLLIAKITGFSDKTLGRGMFFVGDVIFHVMFVARLLWIKKAEEKERDMK